MYFGFDITWPYRKYGKHKNYIEKCIRLTKNKTLEFQIDNWGQGWTLIAFSCRILMFTDHAGFILDFTLFNYELDIHFYDNRHWNHDKGEWEKYPEDK